eukprot:1777478-Rhodomonas_salina.1
MRIGVFGIDNGLAEGRSLQIGIVRVDLRTNSSNFSLERTGITTNTGEDGRNKQTREMFESFLEKFVGTSKVKTDIVVGSEGIGAEENQHGSSLHAFHVSGSLFGLVDRLVLASLLPRIQTFRIGLGGMSSTTVLASSLNPLPL